jgi:integrase
MSRKAKCWSWVTGGYGVTVKLFERVPGGPLYIGVPRPKGVGGYRAVSLKHTDRDTAIREAKILAARRQAGDGLTGPLTVATVFDLYTRAVLPKQCPVYAAETLRQAEMWTRHLGAAFDVRKFGPREWETFGRLRASGELDARGHVVTDTDKREPVGPRVVAKDLKALRAACRRATIERTPSGSFVLESDPTRGLALPVERNPRRPVYDTARVDKLTAVADQVTMRLGWGKEARWERSHLRTLLRLAGDTGRRVGAILALQWADWRPELGTNGQLRWRAEEDKVGREWWAPVTPEVREELERLRRERPGVGEALLFPSPNDAARPVTVQIASDWLRRAEKLAKLELLPGGAWHPFRRRWATERKHLSPKDVAAVGGWVDTTTLQKCYQVADEETMEAVVLQPRRLKRVG